MAISVRIRVIRGYVLATALRLCCSGFLVHFEDSSGSPARGLAGVSADRAAAVIFAHNHPSGNPKPSDADRAIHDQLARAARSLGIRVLDHLVIAKAGHYSFQEAGLT